MTAKDKAKEIYNTMLNVNSHDIIIGTLWEVEYEMSESSAKQCALICVDEIVEFGTKQGIREPMMYWSKVKQEIQKLKN
jgi:precorrin-4 methylase